MEPARLDITIRQGSTFRKKFKIADLTAYPLTDCKARAQVRDSTLNEKIIDFTTENGKIVIDAVLGTIELSLTPTETAALTPQMAKWDLEVVKLDGNVDPFLEGDCFIGAEVTK
jgi:hypothetical protein